MRYISLFSGVEAASVAWGPLGWEPVAFSEIDPFPCAVLAERFPEVPNLGDITEVDWSPYRGAVDVVIGGSPCQSFSIAGGRESLDGESRLMFEYIRAVDEIRPAWLIWENVPGVFSTKDNAFGQLLDELEKLGYGLAWRTLDAQFVRVADRDDKGHIRGWFGPVAQRRRRVFLVGHIGGMVGRSAAVLFERDSVSGNTLPSREKRAQLARAASVGVEGGSSVLAFNDGQITNRQNRSNPQFGDECHTLAAKDHVPVVCMASGHTNAEIGSDVGTTQAARQYKDPPIICIGSDTSNASIDEEIVGTLHVGGVLR